MDFGLSDEQRLLQDTFKGYLDERAPIARVRELVASDDPYDPELWRGLAELGAAGVLIPEAYGGSDLTLLDAALVAQTLGHAVAPTPFLATAVMAPVALRSGAAEQREQWLPGVARGDLRFGVAVTETFSRREEAGVRQRDGRLSGKALMAIDVPGADLLLVAGADGELFVVAADAPGLEIEKLTTIDVTRRTAELRLDGVQPEAALGEGALERMMDAGRIALAADVLGACDAMLERAVEYAKQRSQFGRVIASFQAVKHMCAEMVADLEPARSLLWYSAHSFDELPDEAPLMASHALAHLSEIGRTIAATSTQVHGGIGFTDEQNLHFWFKRIGLARHLLGGPDLLRARAATLQGWAA